MESDEDDVEAQCRMIFEEYEPKEISADEMNGTTSKPDDNEKSSIENETALGKKRLAHENADRPIIPFKKSVNHAQNAMQVSQKKYILPFPLQLNKCEFQSVFLRQETIRKQQEAKEEKNRREIEKRETVQEEKRKSLEAEKPKTGLTPLISPAALIPPSRYGLKSFAPVSNMLAIQRAKEKVQELKAQKLAQHQQMIPKPVTKTIAQTAGKGGGRVAHATNIIQACLKISNINLPTNVYKSIHFK